MTTPRWGGRKQQPIPGTNLTWELEMAGESGELFLSRSYRARSSFAYWRGWNELCSP